MLDHPIIGLRLIRHKTEPVSKRLRNECRFSLTESRGRLTISPVQLTRIPGRFGGPRGAPIYAISGDIRIALRPRRAWPAARLPARRPGRLWAGDLGSVQEHVHLLRPRVAVGLLVVFPV